MVSLSEDTEVKSGSAKTKNLLPPSDGRPSSRLPSLCQEFIVQSEAVLLLDSAGLFITTLNLKELLTKTFKAELALG